MVSVSMRSVLFPGVALVTVGAVALAPALTAPPVASVAPIVQIPAVYVADIALAGIGRDIYDSLSATVQGLVQWAQFAVGIIPFLGGGIRAQIEINYFDLIQPLIANTVYALSDIVADPLGILNTVGAYISNQVYVGYSWVTDQIAFFGLPPILGPIPKPPPLAAVATSSAGSEPARTMIGSRAVAVAVSPPAAEVAEVAEVAAIPEVAGTIDTPEAIEAAETVEVVADVEVVEVVADVDEPARSGRGQARRVAAEARQSARVDVQEASALAATESPAVAEVGAVAEVRVPGRSGRGSVERATGRSGDAAASVASATG